MSGVTEMDQLADELAAKLREYPFKRVDHQCAEFTAIAKVREAVLNVIASRSTAITEVDGADPDFKAETKVEPRAPCEWVYAPESNAIADCKNCGMPIGEHKMATANRGTERG
jgi:hypothetical protein